MFPIVKTNKGQCIIGNKGLYFSNSADDLTAEINKIQNFEINEKTKEQNNNFPTQKLIKLSFFITSNCNLRCIYCYANSGNNKKVLPLDLAFTLIDFASKHSDYLLIDYHGGGEPLLYFDFIKATSEYVKQLGKPFETCLITNGTINNDETLNWIIENINFLGISLDGGQVIQDKNRPFENGTGSYIHISKTIKSLIQNNKKFMVRSTITGDTADKMLDIISHFNRLGLQKVVFSPCYNFGRSQEIKLLPDPQKYSNNFLKAFDFAYKNNMKLSTSSFHLPGNNNYCGADSAVNIGLTPDGDISTCYEVMDSNDEASNVFFIGKINKSTNKITFFKDKINNLDKLIYKNSPSCNKCDYSKICRGGCPVKNIRENNHSLSNKNICQISKLLIPKLLNYIHENPDSINRILNNVTISNAIV
jgi:uncharacterized protein